MKRIPVWLQTLLIALVVVPVVAIFVVRNLQADSVEIVFQTQSNAFRNDEIRKTINEAVSALPKHLADEIREIIIYVVDDAILCADYVAPPGKVIAGCADGNGGEWIELIANNGGYHPFVVVHEFGHIIGGQLTPWGTQRYASYFTDIYVFGSGDSPPTEYGNKYFTEDYADSFALYILNQDKLRRCCNDRYEYFKRLFEG